MNIGSEEEKMNKHWESEGWRIERADDAKLTFTIALHDKRAWKMLLEDRNRYHSISYGWATDNPSDWEDSIEPVLSRLFVKGLSGFATKGPWADLVPMYDPPLCSAAATRAEIVPIHDSRLCGIGAWAAPVAQQSALKRMPACCDPGELQMV